MDGSGMHGISPTSVMTPDHPLWSELLVRLERVERCARTLAHTRAILEGMRGIDVDASLRTLRRLGGVCDCAVLFGLDTRSLA
jgi:hypothetical protein